ncbi:ABC transporter substrate-binding protein [Shouchella lonarensis]|uniref:Iron complex transport system substrate-binding protein n=1 Tax=Shouchella lonarensis TaxID=1464122 RepID=A0A1G6MHA0_9BACI|nr:ABC transporter substrate-binding protein [Shouchella lonarensis]SDC54903.1 iron complex transport system substrate-binding protein [Shouchella lonarensis]
MKKNFILMSVAACFLLAACNQPSTANHQTNNPSTSPTEETYAITDFTGKDIALKEAPKRVAALSNGDMDIIYALGGHVVGRPTAHGPVTIPEAEEAAEVGSTHEINLEKLASVEPDIVLGNAQMNQKDIPSVEKIGAKMVLTEAQSVTDIQSQITLFGELLQKEQQAQELNETMNKHISNLKESIGEEQIRTLLVYGAPGTYMAALPNSLSGNLLELAGGQNIASDFPRLDDYPQYAHLNVERVIEADPQYVLLMSHGNPEEVKEGFMKEMSQNQAWNALDAVQEERVFVLPTDLFGTNPGTRVTEALDFLVKLFEPFEKQP